MKGGYLAHESNEPALETLKRHLAGLPPGRIEDVRRVAGLLQPCWDELIGDTRGLLPLQVPTWVTNANNMHWNPPRLRFEMKWKWGRHTGADLFTVDVETGSLTAENDAVFDKIVNSPPAQKLIAAKLDAITLRSFVRAIAEVPSKEHESPERNHDRAKSVARRCLNLAKAIDKANARLAATSPAQQAQRRTRRESMAKRFLSLATAIRDASYDLPAWISGPEIDELNWITGGLESWAQSPEPPAANTGRQDDIPLAWSLRHFAETWNTINKRRLSKRVADPRAVVILNFMRVVNYITGSPHYEQVAHLLYAINEIPRYRHAREKPRDADGLREMAYEERETLKALALPDAGT